MNDELKAVRNLGAELGAAKAENEKLRGLLEELHPYVRGCSSELWDRYHATLSQQAEPSAEERAAWIDANVSGKPHLIQAMKNIAGCAEAEPAPAQDEREVGTYVECRECTECGHAGINDQADGDSACSHCLWHGSSPDEDKCPECHREGTMSASCPECGCRYRLIADAEIATRPAQTEQQPVAWGAFHFGGPRNGKLYKHCETEQQIESYIADLHRSNDSITLRKGRLYAAPIAQTALAAVTAERDRLRAFVTECAGTAGGMVNGNKLSNRAKELIGALAAKEA